MASPHVTGLAGMLRQIRARPDRQRVLQHHHRHRLLHAHLGHPPEQQLRLGRDRRLRRRRLRARRGRDQRHDHRRLLRHAPYPARKCGSTTTRPAAAPRACGIRKLFSDNTGHYRTILAAGTYTVTVSAPGYYGMNFTTTVMSSTTTTLPIVLAKMATGSRQRRGHRWHQPGSRRDRLGGRAAQHQHDHRRAAANTPCTHVPAGTFTLRAEKCGYTGGARHHHRHLPQPAHPEPDARQPHGAARRRLRVGQPEQLDGHRRQHHHRHLEHLDRARARAAPMPPAPASPASPCTPAPPTPT